MFPRDIYIDLGTKNTLIYAKNRGILLNQPSVIANYLEAVGEKSVSGLRAKEMIGKSPPQVSIFRPLDEGVIKDFKKAKEMLSFFLHEAKNEMLFTRSRILISLPLQVKEYEREIFRELAYELRAGIVHLISEPLAGAIGSGVDIFAKKTYMFLDLGAGTTEAILTFNGRIIRSKAVRSGGNNIDTAIIDHLKRNYQFSIGEQTVEALKKQVATLKQPTLGTNPVQVTGINLVTGLPEKRFVNSAMIAPALMPTFKKISELIDETLSECSPDLISEVSDNGAFLFGGNAMVSGLSEFLTQRHGVPFSRTQIPLLSVAIGGSRVLENDRLFERLLA